MNSKQSMMFLIMGLFVLPGCDWFKNENSSVSTIESTPVTVGNGEVLFSLKGSPVITSGDLENYIDQIMSESPQVKDLIAAIPDAKYNLFTGLVSEELLLEWARENRIAEQATYKKDYELALRMLERQIAQKYFQDYLMKKVIISEKEAREYYDTHKDSMAELQLSTGDEEGKGAQKASRPFEEVKEDIIKMLQNEKASELYMQELDALKRKYEAEENVDYFKKESSRAAFLNNDDSEIEATQGRQPQAA